jgi:hypothetical protein
LAPPRTSAIGTFNGLPARYLMLFCVHGRAALKLS